MQVHSVKVTGPFVAHDRYVVQYDVDVTDKKLEPADAAIRGRRLHRQKRKDRARRVPA
jgi:hypothetical protein